MNNTIAPMKHIFDSSFRYEPSFDTDIRKTFARIRSQQALAHPPSRVNVRLGQLKKVS